MSNTFQLFPVEHHLKCESFQCYNRAAYHLGKREAPKVTIKNICEQCAQELIANITETYLAPEPEAAVEEELPFEPETELEIDGKLVSEMDVKELKAACKSLGLSGYSDKNKGELIALLDKETNDIAVEEHEAGNLK